LAYKLPEGKGCRLVQPSPSVDGQVLPPNYSAESAVIADSTPCVHSDNSDPLGSEESRRVRIRRNSIAF